jgi:glycerol-3-phosphate cytidylyltransferase
MSDLGLRLAPYGELREGAGVSRVVGYAPGAYDLFHVGHLNILRHAKEHCDYLIAGVVSDEMCLLAKGKTPVIPLVERMEIVSHISLVDEVFAEVVPDKVETWRSVQFDILFKGDDWRGTAKGDKLERDFADLGVKIIYFPYTRHTSSTALRRALAVINGELADPEPARVRR